MKNSTLYPIYFEPIYKSYVWGGHGIVSTFARKDAPKQVAESWEVSDRPDGMSIVANGSCKGMTLHDLVLKFGEDLLGKGRTVSAFPLLIKLLDAHDNLSIQVHPDDNTAKVMKAEPKAEMWYFLKTSEVAAVYAGLKPHVDKSAFEKAIQEDKVLETLEKIQVTEGDVVSIPGGRVHAILTGCLLLEVQQNSNTTYRIYDWGRDRPMHIQEALQVIDWENKSYAKTLPIPLQNGGEIKVLRLLKTPYFEMQKIEATKPWQSTVSHDSFQVFFSLAGRSFLEADGNREEMILGRTYLVPAGCKEVTIIPQTALSKFLRITL